MVYGGQVTTNLHPLVFIQKLVLKAWGESNEQAGHLGAAFVLPSHRFGTSSIGRATSEALAYHVNELADTRIWLWRYFATCCSIL